MRDWNPTQELIAVPIDANQYQQTLAELAEIFYEYLKLDPIKPIGPELPDRGHQQDQGKELRYE